MIAKNNQVEVPLPGILQSDRAVVQQDRALIRGILRRLSSDEASGGTALEADRTALRIARIKVVQDVATLHMDARPILQADAAALLAALIRLHSDQVASDADAVRDDQAAVAAAEEAMRAHRSAIFAGLSMGDPDFRSPRRSRCTQIR